MSDNTQKRPSRNPKGRPPKNAQDKTVAKTLSLATSTITALASRQSLTATKYLSDQVQNDLLTFYGLLRHGSQEAQAQFSRHEFLAILACLDDEEIKRDPVEEPLCRPGERGGLEDLFFRKVEKERVHIKYDIDEDLVFQKLRDCDRLVLMGLYDQLKQVRVNKDNSISQAIIESYSDKRELLEPKVCLFSFIGTGRCEFVDPPCDGDISTETKARGLDNHFVALTMENLNDALKMFEQRQDVPQAVAMMEEEIGRQKTLLNDRQTQRDATDISLRLNKQGHS